MSTVVLRGQLEQGSDDGQWKWQGVWAFGASIAVAATPSQKQAQQPFEYSWQVETNPSEIAVPSAPIPEESLSSADVDNAKPPPKTTTSGDETKEVTTTNMTEESSEVNNASRTTPTTEAQEGGEREPISVNTPTDGTGATSNQSAGASGETKNVADNDNKLSSGRMTYAVVPEGHPPFTDAKTRYPDKNCPASGQWKGYFQNVTGRTKDQTQQINETFYMFLNATPCPNNKMYFFDDTPLPPTVANSKCLVSVKGMGENPFGTFELTGYLDLESNILEIQRQYVWVGGPKPTNRGRSSSRGRSSIGSSTSGATGSPVMTRHKTSRPYFTRKRQPSWKRKQDADDDDDESPIKRKKRPKSIDTAASSAASTPTTAPTTGSIVAVAPDSMAPPRTTPVMDPYALGVPPVGGTAQPSAMAGDDFPGIASKAVVGGPGLAQQVGLPSSIKGALPLVVLPKPTTTRTAKPTATKTKKSPSSRKRSSTGSGGATTTPKKSSSSSSIASSSGNIIKLPEIGDPRRARWRAAHFLYYQRQDPDELADNNNNATGGSKSNNASNSAPNPRYVVYEGEMHDSKREGRGICLYSNGMLYEGEWRRNKEHGKGKLMSADRRRTYYEGEFERGRMQGQGTYYYCQAENSTDGSSGMGSRYVGEFKENMRNGYGIYYLPDGSIYNGMWNQGVPSGRGVFTWPDSSLYDGDWKDGKRHGQGLLKTSDGFIYDGMWANNAMDGRGAAIYPNGQKYEGVFSNGRREGRGTMKFTNGAVYEGRFRDDAVDGQGTMKMSQSMTVPPDSGNADDKHDFMIPISFQSDLTHIHTKAGFTAVGD